MPPIIAVSAVNQPTTTVRPRGPFKRHFDLGWRPWYLLLVLVAFAASVGSVQAADTRGKGQADKVQPPFMARYHNERFQFNTIEALELAIRDLMETFKDRYPKGTDYLVRLEGLKAKGAAPGDPELEKLRLEALLANPLLDFDKLVAVKRKYLWNWESHSRGNAAGMGGKAPPGRERLRYAENMYNSGMNVVEGWPVSYDTQFNVTKTGWDNEIAVLSPIGPEGKWTTLYRPAAEQATALLTHLCLHWNADRLLFSMPEIQNPAFKDSRGNTRTVSQYHVYEIAVDGGGLRRLTPGEDASATAVANYFDACYLPNGKIVFASTACMQMVPCSPEPSAVLYVLDPASGQLRQLAFDQDMDSYPSVMNDGRIMYLRWEYTETAHWHGRKVFAMNPDGTRQMAIYGSNSYWPNATWWPRAIPGETTKFVGIAGGHHSPGHQGELVVFNAAGSTHETDGVVQRMPGRNHKVANVIADGLNGGSWPRFKSPWPLSAKYILASCKFNPDDDTWKLALADAFDNVIVIKDDVDFNVFEPIPLRKTSIPPVIPDAVDVKRRDATVYVQDIYQGPGLKNVPRGTIKKLRVTSLFYPQDQMRPVPTGAWTARRILGTVPVQTDGSALFRIPANVNIALHPLDAEGRAVQLMRSWFVGMPGEVVSCVGCHEGKHQSPSAKQTEALSGRPVEIDPWFGPERGFSFGREVQPAVDKYCAGCHDGKGNKDAPVLCSGVSKKGGGPLRGATYLSGPAYAVLNRYVRVPRMESDVHLQKPYEFHADTSELIQLLKKGHHGVELDKESWERLYAWIDLNVPDVFPDYDGKASDDRIGAFFRYRKLYANLEDNPMAPLPGPAPVSYVPPEPMAKQSSGSVACAGWPFTADEAVRRQEDAGKPAVETIELDKGVALELALIPGGEFIIGSDAETLMERPRHVVKVRRPFWMGTRTISNKQFAAFNPEHDSGMVTGIGANAGRQLLSGPEQPVVRVSWQEAMAYCDWLSAKTGRRFTLPTEAQWEWACRAGTDTCFWYGDLGAAPGGHANFTEQTPGSKGRGGCSVVDTKFKANPWGLLSMHGNVAQWTLSDYKNYPYIDDDGRNQGKPEAVKVVRGGSWYDRPYRGTSSYRLGYRADQPVFNVGFRVVCEAATVHEVPGSDRSAAGESEK
ncbi:MAG: SUMF1/EgtB/PvdO family nonheme iron enzyme [Thermoguttaceae bacterium]